MHPKHIRQILAFFLLATCSWVGVYAYSDENLLQMLNNKYKDDYRPKFLALRDIKVAAQQKQDIVTKEVAEKAQIKLLYQNLRSVSEEKIQATGSTVKPLVAYRKIFLRLKKNDLKADRTWGYLEVLEQKIKSQQLSLVSPAYKSYLYLLNYLQKQSNGDEKRAKEKEKAKINSALHALSSLGSQTGFFANFAEYKQMGKDLLEYEGFASYSHDAFYAIRDKILSQQISPASQYFQWFKYVAWLYGKIGNQTAFVLSTSLAHHKQLYSLSCEANSAKDFINFYREKSGKPFVTEEEILATIPADANSPTLVEVGSGKTRIVSWANPNLVFVGSYKGKQSANASIFSGYGVYAPVIAPIIKNGIGIEKNVQIGTFNTERITESLLKGNPVMSWYLKGRKEKNGKEVYNFLPVKWTSPDGQTIKGYIGEHTAVIVGLQTNTQGNIIGFYFYEGNTDSIQSMSIEKFEKLARPFNQAIYIN